MLPRYNTIHPNHFSAPGARPFEDDARARLLGLGKSSDHHAPLTRTEEEEQLELALAMSMSQSASALETSGSASKAPGEERKEKKEIKEHKEEKEHKERVEEKEKEVKKKADAPGLAPLNPTLGGFGSDLGSPSAPRLSRSASQKPEKGSVSKSGSAKKDDDKMLSDAEKAGMMFRFITMKHPYYTSRMTGKEDEDRTLRNQIQAEIAKYILDPEKFPYTVEPLNMMIHMAGLWAKNEHREKLERERREKTERELLEASMLLQDTDVEMQKRLYAQFERSKSLR
jgi:hypothetical protein